jgi:hypothetical protein
MDLSVKLLLLALALHSCMVELLRSSAFQLCMILQVIKKLKITSKSLPLSISLLGGPATLCHPKCSQLVTHISDCKTATD